MENMKKIPFESTTLKKTVPFQKVHVRKKCALKKSEKIRVIPHEEGFSPNPGMTPECTANGFPFLFHA